MRHLFLRRALACLALGTVGLPAVARSQTCTPAPASLVGWWKADGDARDAAGSNDGTLQNGTTIGTGLVGGAFAFDGVDDYVAVPDAATLDFGTGGFTAEMWFKTSTTSAGVLLTKFAARLPLFTLTDDYTAVIMRSSGQLEFRFVDFDALTSFRAITTGSYNDGAWHHLAAVRLDSANAKLYVDGVEVASVTNITGVDLDTDGDILMGGFRYDSVVVGLYRGLLDEASLYSRALSVSEIRRIVAAGAAGKCTCPSSGDLVASVRLLAELFDRLPLSLFAAPNDAARERLRDALAIQIRSSADSIADGRNAAAFASLSTVLAKMDGIGPDWLRPSPVTTALADCVMRLLARLA